MNAKQLEFECTALARIARGVNTLADAVACTLGPQGRNVILERKGRAPIVSKDGVSIACEIVLQDPLDNIGAQSVKEAAAQTAATAGDGTTTTIVLARAIFQEGLKYIAVGISPVELKRGIDKATAAALEAISTASMPCNDQQSTRWVCGISANGDAAIASLIADAVGAMGRDGVILIEQNTADSDALSILEGTEFSEGYASPYFATDPAHRTARLEHPLVLLHPGEITGLTELQPLLKLVVQSRRSLLIIAGGFSDPVLAALTMNATRGHLKVVAVKATGHGGRLREQLDDLAAVTRASVISAETGIPLTRATLTQLGQAARADISSERTVLIGNKSEPAGLRSRIRFLQAQRSLTFDPAERARIDVRLGRLSGKVAVLRIGAKSELERGYRAACAEDALAAVRAALEDGVVPGGGTAFLRAGQAIEHMEAECECEGELAGMRVVRHALDEPLRQIAANAGAHPPVVLNSVRRRSGDFGFDAATGEYVALTERGIIDPAKVSKTALRNAASVAGLLLMTSCAVTRVLHGTKVEDRSHHKGGQDERNRI